jgi:hypothetical protein
MSVIDARSDIGKYTGIFRLADADMVKFRTWIRTNRGNTVSLVSTSSSGLAGVASPFGRRSSSYPYSVKIIEWEDLGPADRACLSWNVKATFAEVV